MESEVLRKSDCCGKETLCYILINFSRIVGYIICKQDLHEAEVVLLVSNENPPISDIFFSMADFWTLFPQPVPSADGLVY